MHNQIQISTVDGTLSAYVARPVVTPAPAVVVIHEVFGVNADMRQSCDELAAQGYLAICPDLFWRTEPGLDLSDRTEAERAKALALYTAFDLDAGVRDIAATIEAARAMPDATGKVGLVGYCLGGLMTYLTTARVGADVAVAYYPGNTHLHLEEAAGIESPLIVHLAGEDEYIPKETQQQIVAALVNHAQVEVHRYPGCHHAFARHRGMSYDAEAAALANSRTDAFLARYLKKG
ncbi:dienelactone hydrolase family protein [Variovorax sp. J22R115]|uniref:dienelactone hydrolase family protein n=1 Tax=Variovorax sp. J22R115 TaxID=3053509 RepID=UPI0025783B61|nr:dienelactone hydrolase family protein [Variovorax sp. J22R115]MDM0049862.1 dienelactone hydrolase family protein [Variovorax sp. J22R115]